MSELEIDEIYRKVRASTGELKKLLDTSTIEQQKEELEEASRKAQESREQRRARKIYATSNVPENNRVKLTFGSSLKSTLIGMLSPLILAVNQLIR